ncbi:hypothetical protein L7F22_002124 [Adiantum nelumboides]|nr:hypothetical protein [Adiantum nelumboides]
MRSSLFANKPLMAALLGFTVAQSLKVFTSWYKEKRWEAKKLLDPGGMASSRAATVMGFAVTIGLKDGLGGSLFAISLVLAIVVMYDTIGVKLHVGHQAVVLNHIVFELPRDHPLADSRPLQELVGYTPPKVIASATTGYLVVVILHVLSGESPH